MLLLYLGSLIDMCIDIIIIEKATEKGDFRLLPNS
jgi:hypothetical protein